MKNLETESSLYPESKKVLDIVRNPLNRKENLKSIQKIIDLYESKINEDFFGRCSISDFEFVKREEELIIIKNEFSGLHRKFSEKTQNKLDFLRKTRITESGSESLVYIVKSDLESDRYFVISEDLNGEVLFTINSLSEIKSEFDESLSIPDLDSIMQEPNDMSLGNKLRKLYY